jgi:hypothetical protein
MDFSREQVDNVRPPWDIELRHICSFSCCSSWPEAARLCFGEQRLVGMNWMRLIVGCMAPRLGRLAGAFLGSVFGMDLGLLGQT